MYVCVCVYIDIYIYIYIYSNSGSGGLEIVPRKHVSLTRWQEQGMERGSFFFIYLLLYDILYILYTRYTLSLSLYIYIYTYTITHIYIYIYTHAIYASYTIYTCIL